MMKKLLGLIFIGLFTFTFLLSLTSSSASADTRTCTLRRDLTRYGEFVDADGKVYRYFIIFFINNYRDDENMEFVAVHRLEKIQLKQDIRVSGLRSTVNPIGQHWLWLQPTHPAGQWEISVNLKGVGPCTNSLNPLVLNVTRDAESFKPAESSVQNIFNPIDGRYNSVGQLVEALMPNLFAIAALLSFGFLVFGGIRFALARGDAKAADSARGIVTSSITGLVIVLASFIIFEIITAVLGFSFFSLIPVVQAGETIDIGNTFRIGGESARSAFPTVASLVTALVAAAIALMGLIFFGLLMWGGLRYMMSRGDEKAVQEARAIMTNAVIGLLIVLAAFAIITVVAIFTGQTNILPIL